MCDNIEPYLLQQNIHSIILVLKNLNDSEFMKFVGSYSGDIILRFDMALLTILIPLAIAIFNDVYQKRKYKNIEFAILDVHVILDYVLRIKSLLLYITLIFVPFALWAVPLNTLRFMLLLLSLFGSIMLTLRIMGVYYWIKGHGFKFRFAYLEELKNPDDFAPVWRSVWQAKNMDMWDQEKFFKIFSNKLEGLFQDDEKKIKSCGPIIKRFGKRYKK